ncbi:MAG: DedA family protein [Thermoleophilia bacterium]
MFITVPANLGYGALAALVAGESAGLPIPGETALAAASLLAGAGHLSLPVVIGVAAGAAIAGDNLGFWIGRRGGRRVLLAERGPFQRHRRAALSRGAVFFERHGGKAVLLGRFVSGVRVVAALVAGASGMAPRRFLIANAAGAVLWASLTGLLVWGLGPLGAVVAVGGSWALAATGSLITALRAAVARRRPPVPQSEPA